MQASAPQRPPTGPPPLSQARRWLGRVAAGLAIGVGVVIVVAVGLRLVFNDRWLRTWAVEHLEQRLETSVELQALQVGMFSGVVLEGGHIEALEGFEASLIRFDRLALRWSLLSLLWGTVTVREIAAQDLVVTLEQNPEGVSNIDIALRRLGIGAAPTPAPPPAPLPPTTSVPAVERKSSWSVPELPLGLDVHKINCYGIGFRWITPERVLSIQGLGAQGLLRARGSVYSGTVWVGLGSRDVPASRGSVRLQQSRAPREVVVSPRVDLTLEALGSEVTVDLRLDAPTEGLAAQPSPVAVELKARGDLQEPAVALKTLTVRMDETSRVSLAGALRVGNLEPTLQIEALEVILALEEVTPWIKPWIPDANLTGRLQAQSGPLESSIAALAEPVDLPVNINLTWSEGQVALGNLRADGIDIQATITSGANRGAVELNVAARQLAVGGVQIARPELRAQGTTRTKDWLRSANAEGQTELDIGLKVGALNVGDLTTQATELEISVQAPNRWLQGNANSDSFNGSARLTTQRLRYDTFQTTGLSASLQTTLDDPNARRGRVGFILKAPRAAWSLGRDAVQLGPAALRLEATRDTNAITLAELRAQAMGAELVVVGGVSALGTDAPRFRRAAVTVPPFEIAPVLERIPLSHRPLAYIRGQAGFQFELDGVVPYRDLLSRAQVPPAPLALGAIAGETQRWLAFLDRWSSLLARGVPFNATAELTVKDADYDDGQVLALGFSSNTSAQVNGDSVALATTLRMREVDQPFVGAGLAFRTRGELLPGELRVTADAEGAQVEVRGLPALEQFTSRARARYRLGGDLNIEELSLQSPGQGVAARVQGRVTKPGRMLLSEAWLQPRLPGAEATLSSKVELKRTHPLELPSGLTVQGEARVNTRLRLQNGRLVFDGAGTTHELSFVSGTTVIEGVTGRLPFEIEMAFDPDSDVTVLRRAPIGSGVVALATSANDVRTRTARPVFYHRLRPYRPEQGLRIKQISTGPYEISNLEMDTRLEDGMLLTDHFSMSFLGGDFQGNAALQLGRQREVVSDFALKFSNMDASYFRLLNLKPGPESELSADLQTSLLVSETQREPRLTMNITKIGLRTLDRFLQFLDPEGANPSIQNARDNLDWVRIEEVRVWSRFENVGIDLQYRALPWLTIPGTQIGFRPIDREALRHQRFGIGGWLDTYLEPWIQKTLVPALSWERGPR